MAALPRNATGNGARVWTALAVLTAFAVFTDAGAETWPEKKCRLYENVWNAVAEARSLEGVSRSFLENHAAFLASGCSAHRHVCPASETERALSDRLTLMAVSEGMSGTFLPFSCSRSK